MSVDLALLDTNVLVYSLFRDNPLYSPASHLVEHARRSNPGFCIVPQVLSELYAVITNPRRVNAPFSPEEALTEVATIRAYPGITLLPVPHDVVDRWTALIKRKPVTGHAFYDVQLVATMLGNDVRKIFTFNTDDFTAFSELGVTGGLLH